MKPIIKVENLSKEYRLGINQTPYSTLRESLMSAVKFPIKAFRRNNSANGDSKLWALKDVGFEIMPGEVVGIIGRNGAGKSTLLKILSRITEPTTGKIELYGRVGSLLEVGTGFHPELTGRENIFLNGAILGMQRSEIARKFDEIVDFAEVEKFIDTPVKFYSSGMYTRLAFAVAANLEPEILIVDEVLAVGDAEFQRKCLGKMKSVSDKEGRTVLFVSHNMDAIRNLCNSCIVLSQGEILFTGKTESAINVYLSKQNKLQDHTWLAGETLDTSNSLKLTQAQIISCEFNNKSYDLWLDLTFYHKSKHKEAFIAIDFHDCLGTSLMQAIPTLNKFLTCRLNSKTNIKLRVSLPPLIPNIYFISVWCGSHNTETLDFEDKILQFEVTESPTPGRIVPHSLDHGQIVPYSEILDIS